MTRRQKLQFAGALARGVVSASADAACILVEALASIRCEFRLAVMLAERGLRRDEVVTMVTPEGEWVILPDGPAERIG